MAFNHQILPPNSQPLVPVQVVNWTLKPGGVAGIVWLVAIDHNGCEWNVARLAPDAAGVVLLQLCRGVQCDAIATNQHGQIRTGGV